eukprot:CAMPEP_0194765502 /NCGR_PEP_ID=MMETSP0323_2-20130528/26831_1 /TAXON_ID=2866 ORGANISM="Crypthecodinium cohnii, Strain Seligo" /NCGR_SAMPLE_ID=MMETSP0323_2 /ASSEMBLY_ACC=CAM_ASM_000346 /LENGTH=168 /DNA_ID=CAMNT_0039695179 /DNA_START=75 /DNA_END=581 /DNA_ORIENTATION=-
MSGRASNASLPSSSDGGVSAASGSQKNSGSRSGGGSVASGSVVSGSGYQASSRYSYSHVPGYGGHQPDTMRNSGKMGKTFKSGMQPPRYTTESTRVGVAAHAASEIAKAHPNHVEFESLRPHESERKFRHHENYGGYMPIAPRNIESYGRSFGTETASWHKTMSPRPW